jgi:hypothetical protein
VSGFGARVRRFWAGVDVCLLLVGEADLVRCGLMGSGFLFSPFSYLIREASKAQVSCFGRWGASSPELNASPVLLVRGPMASFVRTPRPASH